MSHRNGKWNILEMFYNKKHTRDKFVVENAFGILKTFHKLPRKIGQHIVIVPNLVVCCCITHNLWIKCHEMNIEHVFHVLHLKKLDYLSFCCFTRMTFASKKSCMNRVGRWWLSYVKCNDRRSFKWKSTHWTKDIFGVPIEHGLTIKCLIKYVTTFEFVFISMTNHVCNFS